MLYSFFFFNGNGIAHHELCHEMDTLIRRIMATSQLHNYTLFRSKWQRLQWFTFSYGQRNLSIFQLIKLFKWKWGINMQQTSLFSFFFLYSTNCISFLTKRILFLHCSFFSFIDHIYYYIVTKSKVTQTYLKLRISKFPS